MRLAVLGGPISLTMILGATIASAMLPQGLSVSVSPEEVMAAPGEAVNFTLTLSNPTDSRITVEGVRLRVRSEEIFFLPVELDLGEYEFPWDEPLTVPAGETVSVTREVRVPDLDLVAGRFTLEVTAETDVGESGPAEVELTLTYSVKSAAVALLAVVTLLAAAYAVIKLIAKRLSKAESRKRRISRARRLLSERNRLGNLVDRLERRFRQGKISKGEYEKLRGEYEGKLGAVEALLRREAEVLRINLEELTRRAEEIRGEIERLTARAAVGEVRGSEARKSVAKLKKSLREVEREIEEHKEVLGEIGPS